MKNSNDNSWDRTSDLPICSTYSYNMYDNRCVMQESHETNKQTMCVRKNAEILMVKQVDVWKSLWFRQRSTKQLRPMGK